MDAVAFVGATGRDPVQENHPALRVVHLRVEVEDAGKGIPPQKQSEMISAGRTGVGMSGMRERLRQFGGELEVNSAPGHTVVAATIPRPQAKTASAP